MTGVEILISITTYALYRYLKDYFNQRRALNEVEILKKQEDVIAALIKDGFSPEEAQVVTTNMLHNIANRSSDDPSSRKRLV